MRINLRPEDIMSAYSGKPGCACGCRGRYSYTRKFQKQASQRRGYVVTNDEVSDKRVKRVLDTIKDLSGRPDVTVDIGESYISVATDTRVYTVYPAKWNPPTKDSRRKVSKVVVK